MSERGGKKKTCLFFYLHLPGNNECKEHRRNQECRIMLSLTKEQLNIYDFFFQSCKSRETLAWDQHVGPPGSEPEGSEPLGSAHSSHFEFLCGPNRSEEGF